MIPKKGNRGVSRDHHTGIRGILIGLLLSPLIAYWTTRTGGSAASMSLLYTSICSLFFLSILNLAFQKMFPGQGLRQNELIIIYVMMCLVTTMCGETTQPLVGLMGHAFQYATPENEWKELFWRYLPGWLTVSESGTLQDVYRGDSSLYGYGHIHAWLRPVLLWFSFFFVAVMVMLCTNVIFRRRWIEQEKLAYPIIQLPFEMVDGGGAKFFKSGTMWTGFAIAGGITLVNGLHYFHPSVPMFPIRSLEIGHYFTTKPFDTIGWTPVCPFPFVIGLAFFVPQDLALSYWVFYMLWKVQYIANSILDINIMPVLGKGYYTPPQAAGAYVGLAIWLIFACRKYLKDVLKKAIIGGPQMDDAKEPMRYRWAVLGVLLGGGFMFAFFYRAGMSSWVIVLFLSSYYMAHLLATRLRSQLGPPAHEIGVISPTAIIPEVIGTRTLGPQNLTLLAFFHGFNRAYRSSPMPHQLEGLKLAERSRMNSRILLLSIVLSIFVGLFFAFWMKLHHSYQVGMPQWSGWESFNRLQRQLYHIGELNWSTNLYALVGIATVVILSVMRLRFIWWPLHPVAYPLASDWTANWIWFPVFIGWVLKSLILRYGGLRGFRKAAPFFLGLILGDYVVGGTWQLIGALTNRQVYSFWH
ncbi:DUF6785 family protein [Candidatus Poribacteria bacterium]